MKHSLAATRAALTWIVVTASLLTAGLVVAVPAQAATKTYTTSAAVNVRASAATTAAVLGTLAKGARVEATAAASSGWLPITYAATTGYVATTAVTVDKKPATAVVTGPAGKRSAIENVNLRSSGSLGAAIVTVVKKGVALKVTGVTSQAFTQVEYDAKTRWVYSEFLSTSLDTTPAVVATYTTTASLALRATALLTAKNQGTIAKGSKVSGTGVHSGSYSQAIYKGKLGWVITGYLKAVTGTASAYVLPLRKATRYVTTAGTPVRTSADAAAASVATLSAGTALRTTGTTTGNFTAVIWDGASKWVANNVLATTKGGKAPADPVPGDLGSSSLNKLEPYGKAAVVAIRAQFPQIKTIYGWRSASAYSSDHPNGRAIDNMIPSYKTNKALGDALAAWVIANGKKFHVTYIIWRQRSYTISRGSWKAMSDRGGDTANHMDHVHISFEPS